MVVFYFPIIKQDSFCLSLGNFSITPLFCMENGEGT